MRKNSFTLLEILLVITLLMVGGSVLFWRMDVLIKKNRFSVDIEKFKSLLLYSQMMAMSTHSDWRLELVSSEEKWKARLFCREDPDLSFKAHPSSVLGSFTLSVNNQPVKQVFFDFFSTGQINPKGVLIFQNRDRIILSLSELFGQKTIL